VTRLLGRWALLLSGLWLLPVLLIRAQPYDPSALRAFLTPPEGCPAPCFMGIRPGVTTVAEAFAILDEHPWLVPGSLKDFGVNTGFSWWWADAAPSWIDRATRPQLHTYDGEVNDIIVQTTIPWGDFVFVMGKTRIYGLIPPPETPANSDPPYDYRHEIWYQDLGLMAYARGYCRDSNLYAWPVLLQVRAQPMLISGRSVHGMTNCR
jgi:hypothetical protein